MPRVRIKDIAERVGVSQAAASFALNGKPGVSDSIRRQVLQVADELGWRPNVAARSLAAAEAGAVGLVVIRTAEAFGGETFFLQLISGISREIRNYSSTLVLQVVDTLDDECRTYERWYREQRVDGVILVEPRHDDPRPELLASLGMPGVVVGGSSTASIPRVAISDELAMEAIVDHLADGGYSHLAYISGFSELEHTERRAAAFLSRASQRSLRVEPVLFTDYSAGVGVSATDAVLARSPRPDAIIYDSDILALAGLTTIQYGGLRIPEDIALVCWEDNPIWTSFTPNVTALARDATALGAHAASLLLDVIADNTTLVRDEPPPRLIPRASSRARRDRFRS